MNWIPATLLGLALIQNLQADPLDYWTLTHSRTNHIPLRGAFGNGRYVMAVGASGGGVSALSMSEDGTNWRNTFEALVTGLAFGNGLFVAKHEERIYSSPDGETWVTRRLPLVPAANDVRFALGRFWVLARQGEPFHLLTSRDALEWVPALTNAPGRGVLFGDESILILGGDPPIATTNGVDFAPLLSLPQFTSLERIGNTWVGIETPVRDSNIAVSTNGSDWTRLVPSPFFTEGWRVSKVNDRFALISFEPKTYFFESTDGFKWSDHDVGLRFRIHDLVFGRDAILALTHQQLDTPKPGIYTNVARILRSRPFTPTVANPLTLSLRPSLTINTGYVGAGYAIESAESPSGPWIPTATVFPTNFPFHFLAPLEADPKRFYRAVPRDR